jgi:hypothetical protein
MVIDPGQRGGGSGDEGGPDAGGAHADAGHHHDRPVPERGKRRTDRGDRQPGRRDRPGPGAPDGLPGDLRPDERGHRDRQEQQPGAQGAVPLQMLQVERAEEEHRDHQRGRDQDQERPGDHRPAGQDPQIHQRCPHGSLHEGEYGVQHDSAGQGAEGGDGEPAPVAGVDQRVDGGARTRRDEDRAGHVEASARPVRQVRRQGPAQDHEHDQADRYVDVEDPLPSGSGGQDATEEHAGRGPAAAERRPDAECLVPLLAVEGPRHDRQRGRAQQSGADPAFITATLQAGFTPPGNPVPAA